MFVFRTSDSCFLSASVLGAQCQSRCFRRFYSECCFVVFAFKVVRKGQRKSYMISGMGNDPYILVEWNYAKSVSGHQGSVSGNLPQEGYEIVRFRWQSRQHYSMEWEISKNIKHFRCPTRIPHLSYGSSSILLRGRELLVGTKGAIFLCVRDRRRFLRRA